MGELMDKQQMLEILNELKYELADNSSLETHQRQTMEALAEEIDSRINDPDNNKSGDEYLLDRLKDETESFEVNHPKLTHILGRLSDLLSRMGI